MEQIKLKVNITLVSQKNHFINSNSLNPTSNSNNSNSNKKPFNPNRHFYQNTVTKQYGKPNQKSGQSIGRGLDHSPGGGRSGESPLITALTPPSSGESPWGSSLTQSKEEKTAKTNHKTLCQNTTNSTHPNKLNTNHPKTTHPSNPNHNPNTDSNNSTNRSNGNSSNHISKSNPNTNTTNATPKTTTNNQPTHPPTPIPNPHQTQRTLLTPHPTNTVSGTAGQPRLLEPAETESAPLHSTHRFSSSTSQSNTHTHTQLQKETRKED